ncbi:MAG: M20/M25/M40 family metallo-hydrolase [Gammaproteobacteria bacterium]
MSKKFSNVSQSVLNEVSQQWDEDILPQLEAYIRIPNKSPMFDADWKEHGYMDEAMNLIQKWCEKQDIKDMKVELMSLPERTPLLFIEIPGQNDETVLIYGHMDKQPEMRGWDEDKGPWLPVYEDGKLYGRGGADDGYSIFCALSAIAALQRHEVSHSRCVFILEASEESGSGDLPAYMEKLGSRLGSPSLIIALDAACGNYTQLWTTTSIRGMVGGTLKVRMLTQGIHSGLGGGIAGTSFGVLHALLSRLEDSQTGNILLDSCHVNIPPHRIEEAKYAAEILGVAFLEGTPFAENVKPMSDDIAELILNNHWRPSLAITGISGLPRVGNAGNVANPAVTAKFSLRLPPLVDPQSVGQDIKKLFEENPPFNAEVECDVMEHGPGWNAPESAPWLCEANDKASQEFFNQPAAHMGLGGSIPFMGMLGELFPKAQFLITGVLGPKSNAHGPNEFLHIDYVKRLTGCIASVISSHFEK